MKNIAPIRRYQLIDSIRGIAILWIVCFHVLAGVREEYGFLVNYIIKHGSLGVSAFFVISGYGISSTISQGYYWGKPFLFLKKRLNRIYQPYWWHLLFAALIIPVVSSLFAYLKSRNFNINLFDYSIFEWLEIVTLSKVFTASSWKLNIAFLPINGVVWFIAIIVQIYIFISICLFFGKKHFYNLLLVGFAISIVSIFSIAKEYLPIGLFIPYFSMFYIGFVLHFIIKNKSIPQNLFLRIIILSSSSSLLSYCLYTKNQFRSFSFALFIGVVLLEMWKYDKKLSKFLPIKLFYMLGIFSYSLYLLHVPLWPFVGMFVRNLIPLPPNLSGPFVLIPIIIILSYIWYLFFEKPTTFQECLTNMFHPARVIREGTGFFKHTNTLMSKKIREDSK